MCNLDDNAPFVCTCDPDQDFEDGYDPEPSVNLMGTFTRLVIHIGDHMMDEYNYERLLSPMERSQLPTTLVLFIDSLAGRDLNYRVFIMALASVLAPSHWWSSDAHVYAFDEPENYDGFWRTGMQGTTTPGYIPNLVMVGAEAHEIPGLGGKFGESQERKNLADIVRAIGDAWYGREELEKRCKFFTREEYEAHVGPERFRIEDGVVGPL
jgi:hypothetical protein